MFVKLFEHIKNDSTKYSKLRNIDVQDGWSLVLFLLLTSTVHVAAGYNIFNRYLLITCAY